MKHIEHSVFSWINVYVKWWGKSTTLWSLARWESILDAERPQLTSRISQYVWAEIVGDWVIGPIFFKGTLNEANYLKSLQEKLIPNLAMFPDSEETDIPNRNRPKDPSGNFWIQYFSEDELVEGDPWNCQPSLQTSLHWTNFYGDTWKANFLS